MSDIFIALSNEMEKIKTAELTPYEYLNLRIKLVYLMRIEEQLDAIRLCLIEGNKN